MPYQWGVYTTAWARYELQCAIDIIPFANFLYCDTDSVYYIDGDNINFDNYNKEKIRNSKKNKACAEDVNKKVHYMGVFEVEHTRIKEFKTLGAKKYGFIETVIEKGVEKDILSLTVAGVSKKYGAKELIMSQCPLYNKKTADIVSYCPLYYNTKNCKSVLELFSDDLYEDELTETGFVFKKAGGTEVVYNDKHTKYASFTIKIDDNEIYVPTSAVIRESTYEISLDKDYSFLLDNLIFTGALEQYLYTQFGINADIMEQ